MNRTQRILTLIFLPILIAVAGCATNALRVEAAKDVASKGKAVAEKSTAYLDQVERLRYAFNADIIAADPACHGDRATYRELPRDATITNPRRPPRGWLCTTLRAGERASHGVMLGRVNADLEPTILLVESLGAYSAAITDVLEAPHSDPAADFDHAVETANAAKGLIEALGGTVGFLTTERTDAISGFIGFVAELSQEQDTVRRLRLLAQPEGGATRLIATLRRHLTTWEISRQSEERMGLRLAEIMLTASTNPRAPLDADQRRQFAQNYYDRLRAQEASGDVKKALDRALKAFGDAESEYRELLRDNPNLTPRQRARRAAIIRERLTRGLRVATSLLTAFGV
jgi:hypothetical protein